MPLYIDDDEVCALAKAGRLALGLDSDTEVVRQALMKLIADLRSTRLAMQIEEARSLADKIGPVSITHDAKRDADASW